MARTPLWTGTLTALAAAVAFGLVTPLVARLGRGVGPLATACLLYAGALTTAVPALLSRGGGREAALRRQHLPRLGLVAFFGAALAPTLLAWGLQRLPAVQASLLLNAEAVITVVLAALLYHEHVGRRVAVAATLMAVGGALVIEGAGGASPLPLTGALAVTAAVTAWALDNVLTRPLAALDPGAVVGGKALLGATFTFVLAVAAREPWPGAAATLGLVACGAAGYGLSLRLYLRAQRVLGAARTGSVFATAPFVGAALALALGDRGGGVATPAAAACFAVGVLLHLTERHEHRHTHGGVSHDHGHRHDDGHHDHPHDGPAPAWHSHPHTHPAQVHSHPHTPDDHHHHDH